MSLILVILGLSGNCVMLWFKSFNDIFGWWTIQKKNEVILYRVSGLAGESFWIRVSPYRCGFHIETWLNRDKNCYQKSIDPLSKINSQKSCLNMSEYCFIGHYNFETVTLEVLAWISISVEMLTMIFRSLEKKSEIGWC